MISSRGHRVRRRRLVKNNVRHDDKENIDPQPSTLTIVKSPVKQQDQKCGICLDAFDKQGKINSCSHLFCFECIHFWSKVIIPNFFISHETVIQ